MPARSWPAFWSYGRRCVSAVLLSPTCSPRAPRPHQCAARSWRSGRACSAARRCGPPSAAPTPPGGLSGCPTCSPQPPAPAPPACSPPPASSHRKGEGGCGFDLFDADAGGDTDMSIAEQWPLPLVVLGAPVPESRLCRDFELLGVLGRGGGGVVFKVRRRDTPAGSGGGLFAVKRISLDSLRDAAWVQLLREATILDDMPLALPSAELARSKHLVAVRHHWLDRATGTELDLETSEAEQSLDYSYASSCSGMPAHASPGAFCLYLEMDYCGGGDLRKWLEQEAPPPLRQVLEVMLQVLLGLRLVHAHGVLHRDLKPTNVLFDADGSVRIADFGLSVPLDRTVTPGDVQWAEELLRSRCGVSAADARGAAREDGLRHKVLRHMRPLRDPAEARRALRAVQILTAAGGTGAGASPKARGSPRAPHAAAQGQLAAAANRPRQQAAQHTTGLGSPFYSAPEVRRVSKRRAAYGTSCDLYSVGVMLYEAVHAPRTASERERLLSAFCSAPARAAPPQGRRGGAEDAALAAAAVDLAQRLAALDPQERPAAERAERELLALLGRAPGDESGQGAAPGPAAAAAAAALAGPAAGSPPANGAGAAPAEHAPGRRSLGSSAAAAAADS
eukprot:TRINITY_DN26145_c0_g1_i3.p1 TRINITY_DN26145_c0_g1~~TRINITY_DN26145_c0_g1_i3.p1  ORF type:complete len:620 (+),score=175.18 TRINITY_DN26145_c0_g1_i3:480-2339(+)